jgi:hypothetical protein
MRKESVSSEIGFIIEIQNMCEILNNIGAWSVALIVRIVDFPLSNN